MDSVSQSCAICLNLVKESPGIRRSRTSTALGRKIRIKDATTVVRLQPCAHEFHHTCISMWVKQSPRCPIDLRLIMGSTPPMSRPVNLRQELFKSIEGNQIENVREILLTGFNPAQRSILDRKNPLNLSLKKQHWEIAALLISAGLTTSSKVAQYSLGWMYRNGLGVEKNYAVALTWFGKAANQGNVDAQNILSRLRRDGPGLDPSP